jgi:type II secretory pathway pseudopilin PulG
MKQKKTLKSVTLLEILLVVVIASILLTLALPNFRLNKERDLDREAKANLKTIQAAQKAYFAEHGAYFDTSPPAPGDPTQTEQLNTGLHLDLFSGNWEYASCPELIPGNPPIVHLKARRSNPLIGLERDYYIDQDNEEACCCSSDSRCAQDDWCPPGHCPNKPTF